MARVGVFYSIGFFLLMGVFLLFTFVVLKESRFTNERLTDDVALVKIHSLDESIQKSFRDLFFLTSGISLSTSANSLTFMEVLPNVQNTSFKNNLSLFKQFIESNYSVTFNTTEIANNLSLFVNPYGIRFTHLSYGGKTLKVFYDTTNFAGFNLTLTVTVPLNVNSCTSTGTSSNPYLSVTAVGSTGSCSRTDITQLTLLDTNTPQNVLARVSLGGKTLNVTYLREQSLTVAVVVSNLNLLNESVTVTTVENVLRYTYPDFGFAKNGTIRVL